MIYKINALRFVSPPRQKNFSNPAKIHKPGGSMLSTLYITQNRNIINALVTPALYVAVYWVT